jgi:hypothetical protein
MTEHVKLEYAATQKGQHPVVKERGMEQGSK